MPFKLPPLPYDRDARAPHMSPETLDLHLGRHHRAKVDHGNARGDYTAAVLSHPVNWTFVAMNLDRRGLSRGGQG